jgi:hypothetical protein
VHTNDTGLDNTVVFTGSLNFQVKEVEVFEITDGKPSKQETSCIPSILRETRQFASIGEINRWGLRSNSIV